MAQSLLQIVEPGAGFGAYRDHRRIFEKRSAQILLGFEPHQLERVGIDQIALGQRHNAALDAQQAADLEVLARLRLDGFVRGNDQQQHVDSRRARQHVANKPLVPRHIHKAEAHAMLFEESKPQIDGDAAALLFFEPVGMRSGERLDERRLAVVDMPGRADDDAFRCRRLHCRSHGDLPAKIPFRSPMLLEGRFRRQTGVLLGCYLAAAISSTIDCAATRGSAEARIGRPTTTKSAPARMASRGDALRD